MLHTRSRQTSLATRLANTMAGALAVDLKMDPVFRGILADCTISPTNMEPHKAPHFTRVMVGPFLGGHLNVERVTLTSKFR